MSIKKMILDPSTSTVFVFGSIFLLNSENHICEIIGLSTLLLYTIISLSIDFIKELKA